MVGLDAAGKTTILYKIRFGEVVQTTPTPGFNVETIEYKNLKLTVWDLGGQEKMRRNLWKQFYMGTQGIIFVLDSSDVDRIEDAAEELHQMLRAEELKQAFVLVYANKQDFQNSLSGDEVKQRMHLDDLGQSRDKWHVQPTNALTGEGVMEGLDWLAGRMHTIDQDWFTATLANWQRQWNSSSGGRTF